MLRQLLALGIVMIAPLVADAAEETPWSEPLLRIRNLELEGEDTVYEMECRRNPTDADRATLKDLLERIFALEGVPNTVVTLGPAYGSNPRLSRVTVNIRSPNFQKLEYAECGSPSYDVLSYARCADSREALVKVFCHHQWTYGAAGKREGSAVAVTHEHGNESLMSFQVEWDPRPEFPPYVD